MTVYSGLHFTLQDIYDIDVTRLFRIVYALLEFLQSHIYYLAVLQSSQVRFFNQCEQELSAVAQSRDVTLLVA